MITIGQIQTHLNTHPGMRLSIFGDSDVGDVKFRFQNFKIFCANNFGFMHLLTGGNELQSHFHVKNIRNNYANRNHFDTGSQFGNFSKFMFSRRNRWQNYFPKDPTTIKKGHLETELDWHARTSFVRCLQKFNVRIRFWGGISDTDMDTQ